MSALYPIVTEYAVYICFTLIWAAHFIFSLSYFKVARIVRKQKAQPSPISKEPVSVVVIAHNEADKLRRNLPHILEQDYEQFEVIVVNNASTDETEDVLKYLELKYLHLRHTFIPSGTRNLSPKKLALTIGIKAALYDWVLFVEPDCYPQTSNWISEISKAFTAKTQIVLGCANHTEHQKWLHRKSSFYNLFHEYQYLTWAMNHKAYRCHPANFAYRKSLFLEHKGFLEDVKLLEGAAELLVNRHGTKTNTTVVLSPEAKMICKSPDTSANWQLQRAFYYETRRHFKTKNAYRFMFVLKQLFIHLFYWAFVGTLIWSILHQQWLATGLTSLFFMILILCKIYWFNRSCKAIGESTFYLPFLWLESRILWWEVSSWFKHSRCEKRIFYRKAY